MLIPFFRATPVTAQGMRYDSGKPIAKQVLDLMRTTHKDGPESKIGVIEVGTAFMTKDTDYFNGRFTYDATHDIGWGKGHIYRRLGKEDEAGVEALTLAANSSIEWGAVPVKMAGFNITMPEKNDELVFNIARGMAIKAAEWDWGVRGREECRYPIIMSGKGDVSIFRGFDGIQVSVTLAGYCRGNEDIQKVGRKGSLLIGLESNGVHCSAIAFLLQQFEKQGMALDNLFDGEVSFAEELGRQTRSYLMPVKKLMYHMYSEFGGVKSFLPGMVHIRERDWRSGEGGLMKLKELLHGNDERRLDVFLKRGHSLQVPKIYSFVNDSLGVSAEEMVMFNNGMGFVIAAERGKEDFMIRSLAKSGVKADVVGEIREGRGRLVVESPYDGATYTY